MLAHFPVVSTDTDTTKTRIVFDASAQKYGISVNDLIHAGPKLPNDLFDVLMRFRRISVAVIRDIRDKFHRLVFGLNSAPSEAQYISQKNAKENQKEFPLAMGTVLKSTCMKIVWIVW